LQRKELIYVGAVIVLPLMLVLLTQRAPDGELTLYRCGCACVNSVGDPERIRQVRFHVRNADGTWSVALEETSGGVAVIHHRAPPSITWWAEALDADQAVVGTLGSPEAPIVDEVKPPRVERAEVTRPLTLASLLCGVAAVVALGVGVSLRVHAGQTPSERTASTVLFIVSAALTISALGLLALRLLEAVGEGTRRLW
jgi:hypothetical protein